MKQVITQEATTLALLSQNFSAATLSLKVFGYKVTLV